MIHNKYYCLHKVLIPKLKNKIFGILLVLACQWYDKILEEEVATNAFL